MEQINWIQIIMDCVPNLPNDSLYEDIWSDGDEILVRTESGAYAIADLIELLYRAQGKEVVALTGYYDPEEDKENNEEDIHTGWWYVVAG